MSDLVIREAEVRDIDHIVKLDELCFSVPWSRESIAREIIDNHLAFYIVAEIENTVVGYAGLWSIVDEGHITNVAVHPNFRKKGIGEALVKVILDNSIRNGLKSHTLEVRFSNEAAIRLYEKMGFKAAGLRKKYYEDNGEDAIIMWRNE